MMPTLGYEEAQSSLWGKPPWRAPHRVSETPSQGSSSTARRVSEGAFRWLPNVCPQFQVFHLRTQSPEIMDSWKCIYFNLNYGNNFIWNKDFFFKLKKKAALDLVRQRQILLTLPFLNLWPMKSRGKTNGYFLPRRVTCYTSIECGTLSFFSSHLFLVL